MQIIASTFYRLLLNLPLYHLISHGGEVYDSLTSLFDENSLAGGVTPQELLKITINKDFEFLLKQMRLTSSENNSVTTVTLLFTLIE